MIILGTSYFPTKESAKRYYKDYFVSRADLESEVCRKISEGEISIGLPECKTNEQVILIDGRTRYAIVSER